MSGRRIFIGDIQGCREELERLLEAVSFDPAADELHPAGDLVNRGPDSLGVLRLLRSLDAGGVLGNHDLHLLRRARGERPAGSRDTLEDLLAAEDRDELLAWLGERPLLLAWDDLLCVHAGLSPAWADPVAVLAGRDPLDGSGETSFAVSARYCDPGGERPAEDWPVPAPPQRPWHAFWNEREDERRTVVCGHWARQGLLIDRRLRALDTGCVWGRQLTAWIAEEERIVQVEAARVYSPTSLPPEAFEGSDS